MATVTKPMILDETGQQILEAIQGIKSSVDDGALAVHGKDGAAAGFGIPVVKVTNDDPEADPSVVVTASGDDTAKVFEFEFKNIKGKTGGPGPKGEAGKGDTVAEGVGIKINKNDISGVATINLSSETQTKLAQVDKHSSQLSELETQVDQFETTLETKVETIVEEKIETIIEENITTIVQSMEVEGSDGIDASTDEGKVSIKLDGTTKTNVDKIPSIETTANAALPKAGGTMTGPINMGSKKITDLDTPTDDADATNKKYVDDKFGAVKAGDSVKAGTGIDVQNSDGTATISLEADIQAKIEKIDTIEATANAAKDAAENVTSVILTDDTTSKKYKLGVSNGKISLTEIN